MRKYSTWVAIIILILSVYLALVIFGPSWLKLINVKVADAKTMTDALRSFTETVAIVIAGIWTYNRFIKAKEETREDYPYPKIQHRCEPYDLDTVIYLGVFVTVTNEGKRKLNISGDLKIYVRQVSPLHQAITHLLQSANNTREGIYATQNGKVPNLFIDSGNRIGWVILGFRNLKGINLELEPGQTKEIQCDFFIKKEAKVVSVISYFDEKMDLGLVTLHPLGNAK